MLTVKKQWTAFAMLLIVVLSLFLSIGLFVNQKIIQSQRDQRFDTEFLETISIPAENFSGNTEEKEILIDGKLFDIKSIKQNGGNLVLTGFFDAREQKIAGHIRNIEKQTNDSKSPLQQLTAKFLFLPNYKESAAFSIQHNWYSVTTLYPVYAETIADIAYPETTPPPKYC